MAYDKVLRLAAAGCIGMLMTGCVMAEKYEAEKARSLNFQRLLAQEEKRTGDLDAELKQVKAQAGELEGRNREMTAQIQFDGVADPRAASSWPAFRRKPRRPARPRGCGRR